MRTKSLILSLFLSSGAWAADTAAPSPKPAAKAAESSALKSDDQKMLYTLGAVIGHNLIPFRLSTEDLKVLNMGVKDVVTKQPLKVDVNAYAPRLAEFQDLRDPEKRKGKEYADKAAHEKGAQLSPSGLIYIPLKEGAGPSPAATDTIKASYVGRLVDGTEFDNSKGNPISFPLNGVVRCWTEGIQKMKVGGAARLVCPSRIAYGDAGVAAAHIPGGATLVFDVELIEVVGKK